MNELSDIPLLKIFNFLNASEKINLMLVCKRWNLLIDPLITELLIYKEKYPYRKSWSLSRKKIKTDHCVEKILEKKCFLRYKSLKKLFIFKLNKCQQMFDWLNNLKQLKELVIQTKIVGLKHFEINLPDLNILRLQSVYDCDILHLNTPSLENLIISNFKSIEINIQIEHPESIKFLKCPFIKNKNFNGLINLEHLICLGIHDEIDLNKFPKLNRLEVFPTIIKNSFARSSSIDKSSEQIFPSYSSYVPKHSANITVNSYNVVRKLNDQKTKLSRQDLKIWISGIKDNYERNFTNHFLPVRYDNKIYMYFCSLRIPRLNFLLNRLSQQEQISELPYDFLVPDYQQIIDQFPDNKIPKYFFKTFTSIKQLNITVYEAPGIFDLIYFLKKSRTVKSLQLSIEYQMVSTDSNGKRFFDELSQIQSIQWLTLLGTIIDLNFEIFSNLKNIKTFIFDCSNMRYNHNPDIKPQKLAVDSLYQVLSFNKTLQYFKFGNGILDVEAGRKFYSSCINFKIEKIKNGEIISVHRSEENLNAFIDYLRNYED